VIESDPGLARIIVNEVQRAVTFPVQSCAPKNYASLADGSVPVAVSFSLTQAREVVPKQAEILTLKLNSAGASLAHYLPA